MKLLLTFPVIFSMCSRNIPSLILDLVKCVFTFLLSWLYVIHFDSLFFFSFKIPGSFSCGLFILWPMGLDLFCFISKYLRVSPDFFLIGMLIQLWSENTLCINSISFNVLQPVGGLMETHQENIACDLFPKDCCCLVPCLSYFCLCHNLQLLSLLCFVLLFFISLTFIGFFFWYH